MAEGGDDVNSEMVQETIPEAIRNNASLARAAEKLGRVLLERHKIQKSEAAEIAAHELSHGIADKEKHLGVRTMGYDIKGGKLNAYYRFGPSTAKNKHRVATAPSRTGMSKYSMSQTDVELAVRAKKGIVKPEKEVRESKHWWEFWRK